MAKVSTIDARAYLNSVMDVGYPPVQYVATTAISSLTDSTHFDLAGNTLAPNDRALFPIAGTYVGIFVWSGSAWSADPSFTVREGAQVHVIRSTGAPTYRQTAATGSAAAEFELAVADDLRVTSSLSLAAKLAINNPVIVHGGGGWKNFQVQTPHVFIDPTNRAQLVMYFGGMAGTTGAGAASVGRATAKITDPTVWTEDAGNPVDGLPTGMFLDQVIAPAAHTGNVWWIAMSNDLGSTIRLFTSADGLTFTEDAASPVLTADGQGRDDGDSIVWSSWLYDSDNTTWYMVYNHRTPGVETLTGVSAAQSSDGKTWTKIGSGDILHVQGGTAWAGYFESQQLLKHNGNYVMFCSNYVANGHWTINMFQSSSMASGWASSGVQFSLANRGYHVSTWNMYQLGTRWFCFYQYATDVGNYGEQHWDIGCAEVESNPLDLLVTPLVSMTPLDLTNLKAWWRPDLGATVDGSAYLTALVDQKSGYTLQPSGGGHVRYTAADSSLNNKPAMYMTSGDVAAATHLRMIQALATSGGTLTLIVVGYSSDATGGKYAQFGSGGTCLQMDYWDLGAGSIAVSGDGVSVAKVYAGGSVTANGAVCLVTNWTDTTGATTHEKNGSVKSLTGSNATAFSGSFWELFCGAFAGAFADVIVCTPALSAPDLAALKSGYIIPRYGAITS